MHWSHEIHDARSQQSWASWLQQFCSIHHLACWHEFRTTFSHNQSPRNDQHSCGNFLAYAATFMEFAKQFSWFPCVLHTMSLYIDMKMILPMNCSGSHLNSAIMFWISSRIPNVMNPGTIFHSNSIGPPSIRSKSLRWRVSKIPLNFVFPSLDYFSTDTSQT